jgi:hypothetical protein
MNEIIAKLKTPESCEQFAINVQQRSPELARAARRRAVELRAEAYGASTAAEREALEAIYAYEGVLSETKGKKIRANRTWQMIERLGIIPAVERIVSRPASSAGYEALVKMDMQDMAFEAVVLRYPHLFTDEAVTRSKERLTEWSGTSTV